MVSDIDGVSNERLKHGPALPHVPVLQLDVSPDIHPD
jgi:hypothetical protein